MVFANAGHTAPIPCLEECSLVGASHGPPLGALSDSRYETGRIELPVGATLTLYTDGITEARRDHEFFGEERLLELVRDWRAKEPGKLAEDVLKQALGFTGDRPSDDAIVLVVRRLHQ